MIHIIGIGYNDYKEGILHCNHIDVIHIFRVFIQVEFCCTKSNESCLILIIRIPKLS